MMMVNNSLQELSLEYNKIGDDGIAAIAGVLADCACKINTLSVMGCGITLAGARSLAAALSSNHTTRHVNVYHNSITMEGVLLIKSAVHDALHVQI